MIRHPYARVTWKIILPIVGAAAILLATLLLRNREQKPSPVGTQTAAQAAPDLGPDSLLAAIKSGAPPPEMRQALDRLRGSLLAMPRAEAAAWIAARLNAGGDVSTGLGFSIGSDQALTEWPSLRVLLLDTLLMVDPAAAAQAGREILTVPTTADEWALAMRNVARGGDRPEDTALLQAKFRALLHHRAWREQPTDGYLQVFDVIVHTRDTALTPDLMACTHDLKNQPVRHAAFLALDRLVQAEPAAMLPALADTETASGLMVSNMMARADVRETAPRAAVERWLLNEQRTAAELQGFAGVFPNANQMVSHNLLTTTPAADGAARAVQDRAALAVVEQWLTDARFARAHALLRSTRERLRQFVGSP